jgi:hypothetical protein
MLKLFHPLAKPYEEISIDLKKITPIGAHFGDVLATIENNDKWDVQRIVDAGYYRPYHIPSEETLIGSKYVSVSIGTYIDYVAMEIYGIWVFDEDSELIEIFVTRGFYSPPADKK